MQTLINNNDDKYVYIFFKLDKSKNCKMLTFDTLNDIYNIINKLLQKLTYNKTQYELIINQTPHFMFARWKELSAMWIEVSHLRSTKHFSSKPASDANVFILQHIFSLVKLTCYLQSGVSTAHDTKLVFCLAPVNSCIAFAS